MKKVTLFISLKLLAGIVLLNHIAVGQNIHSVSLVEKCQTNIKSPYTYDGYWMSKFVFDERAKKIEGHFVAFEGEKYQIVFCSSGFEELVEVAIFYKSSRLDNNRIKVYDSSQNVGKGSWTFEPPKSGDYYVEYTIPPSKSGDPKQASVLILFGTIIDLSGN